MKKLLSLAALLLTLCLLAGCGSQPSVDYPELPAVDTSAMDLESAQNSSIKISFPAGEWVPEPNSDPLTIVAADTAEDAASVNLNAQVSGSYSGTLSESEKDELVQSLAEQGPFMNVKLAELRSLNGEPVIYMEETVSITDDAIDWMIENGIWTETWVEQNGGRDAFLSIPDTDQVMLYAVKDGNMCIYTGSYYEESQKSGVLEALTVLVETTELLG